MRKSAYSRCDAASYPEPDGYDAAFQRTIRPASAAIAWAARSGRILPATGRALVRAAEERERRLRENLEIEPRRAVIDVPEVELDALGPWQRRATVHLCPPGDPRLDGEAPTLALIVALDLVAQCRPRADDAHLPTDDVPKLRQLVERQ